jgi:ABC-type nitrate/sulfonate/bicarbonate transport system permease component
MRSWTRGLAGRLARPVRSWGKGFRTLTVLTVLAGIWELVSRLRLLDPFLFPAPSEVAGETVRAFFEPPRGLQESLFYHLGKSLQRALIGWGIGSAVGIAFGVAIEWTRGLPGRIGNSLLEFARPVPSILVLPVLTVFLGITDWPRILVIAWGVFIVVAINTMLGVRSARQALLPSVIRSFGGNGWMILRKAVFGLAAPYIVAGMRQAVGMAVILMVATELILATDGIGWFIGYTRRLLSPPLMYGSVVMVGLVGLGLGALFRLLQKRLLRGHHA